MRYDGSSVFWQLLCIRNVECERGGTLIPKYVTIKMSGVPADFSSRPTPARWCNYS